MSLYSHDLSADTNFPALQASEHADKPYGDVLTEQSLSTADLITLASGTEK